MNDIFGRDHSPIHQLTLNPRLGSYLNRVTSTNSASTTTEEPHQVVFRATRAWTVLRYVSSLSLVFLLIMFVPVFLMIRLRSI